ncbi:MAG: hypothetical protein U0931_19620 [Vulcanimicrobiota bacterium]
MSVCGWCGRQTSRSKEYRNGPAVLRLCPDCAENGIGKVSAGLLNRTSTQDEDEIPARPAWVTLTAKILLASVMIPLLLVVIHFFRLSL